MVALQWRRPSLRVPWQLKTGTCHVLINTLSHEFCDLGFGAKKHVSWEFATNAGGQNLPCKKNTQYINAGGGCHQ